MQRFKKGLGAEEENKVGQARGGDVFDSNFERWNQIWESNYLMSVVDNDRHGQCPS